MKSNWRVELRSEELGINKVWTYFVDQLGEQAYKKAELHYRSLLKTYGANCIISISAERPSGWKVKQSKSGYNAQSISS